jgi:hypothetical protein
MQLPSPLVRVWHAVSFAALLALTACSGGDGPVRYSGTTLIVEGKEYERSRAKDYDSLWGQGAVLVTARQGREAELNTVLKRFSLSAIPTAPGTRMIIAVPVGFEEQWANALAAQPSVFTTANEDPTIDRP